MVVLEEVNGDGQVTNRLEETVMVKYVRREIRTLTDDEKEELLDAVSEHRKKERKQFAYCRFFCMYIYCTSNIPPRNIFWYKVKLTQ